MTEIRIGIITCSDSRATTDLEDVAGQALMGSCEKRGWLVIAYHVCPDESECIATSIIEMCDVEDADVVLTVGGTGLDPRDITPEATERVCERMVPGIAETIRSCCMLRDANFALSRGVAGVRDRTLIINLPGGETQPLEGFEAIADHLETAVGLLRGPGHD